MATIDARGFASAPGTTTSGIQEAIDALPAQGGAVEIPAGTFPITTAIAMPADRPVRLYGAGRGATNITCLADVNADMLHVKGDYSSVSDLTLTGAASVSAGAGRGIVIGRPAADATANPLKGVVLERVNVESSPSYNIYMRGTSDPGYDATHLTISVLGAMRDVTCNTSKAGALLKSDNGNTTWSFDNCSFRRAVDNHILLGLSAGFRFRGGSIEEPLSIGGVRPWILLASCSSVTLDGVWFEQATIDDATNAMIFLNDGSNDGINVNNCIFSRKRSDGTALKSNIMVIGGTGGTPGKDTNVTVRNMVVTANADATPEILIDAACNHASIIIEGGRCAARASLALKVTDNSGIAIFEGAHV